MEISYKISKKRDQIIMDESLIVRKGGVGISSSGNIFRTEIITVNTN